jgi:hypothetical protein
MYKSIVEISFQLTTIMYEKNFSNTPFNLLPKRSITRQFWVQVTYEQPTFKHLKNMSIRLDKVRIF